MSCFAECAMREDDSMPRSALHRTPPTRERDSECLIGISTGALHDGDPLHRLLAFDPDVVELYGLPVKRAKEVVARLNTLGIKVALHAPTPFDGPRPLAFL